MKTKIKYIVIIILSFFLGIILTIMAFQYMNLNEPKINKNINITENDSLSEAIKKVDDAVFVIETYSNNRIIATGTGFVYKKNNKGYVITNYHVIENGTKIIITNASGQKDEAKLLGSDEYTDIAVLAIDKKMVNEIIPIGSTEKAELGDTVFTIGSPLGTEYMGTVTKGILSGKNRKLTVSQGNGDYVMEVLQTDAAINPGNSGGPLLNINGEVIGVNSLKLVQNQVEGMGFAIPIEMVMSVVGKLEKGQKIDRPILGTEMLDVTNKYALLYNGIKLNEKIKNGAVVINVIAGTPAKKADLQKGDVIISIDNKEVIDSAHLKYMLYKYNIGDKIKVKYIRNNKIETVSILLNKGV